MKPNIDRHKPTIKTHKQTPLDKPRKLTCELVNLTEKTFLLLGSLKHVDLEDAQWQKEFGEAMIEQAKAMQPFLQQK